MKRLTLTLALAGLALAWCPGPAEAQGFRLLFRRAGCWGGGGFIPVAPVQFGGFQGGFGGQDSALLQAILTRIGAQQDAMQGRFDTLMLMLQMRDREEGTLLAQIMARQDVALELLRERGRPGWDGDRRLIDALDRLACGQDRILQLLQSRPVPMVPLACDPCLPRLGILTGSSPAGSGLPPLPPLDGPASSNYKGKSKTSYK